LSDYTWDELGEIYITESETGRGPRLVDTYNKPPYSDDSDSKDNPPKLKVKTPKRKLTGTVRKEQVDLYDVILSHLLDEGFADTLEGAEAIMVNMSEDWKESIVEEEGGGPKPTKMPLSRERNIGRHDDWKDKPLEWGERPPAAKKLKSRLNAVVGTQRRQDVETGVRKSY
jgi:hypothetical protein